MTKKCFLINLMAITLCLGFAYAANGNEDSPPMVSLTGILKSKMEYGPPGYGETPKTDPKIKIFVLKLSKSQTGRQLSLPGEATRKFSEIQLRCDSNAMPQCEPFLEQSIGRQITVSGETDGQTYPTDYLPVILYVRTVAKH
jgi:hypothetical protein